MRRTLLAGLIVIVVAALLGVTAGLSLQEASRDQDLLTRVAALELESAEQVAEHREANQRDHDCIVALALLLADPRRDRTAAIIPPPSCRQAPAKANVEATEGSR